MSKKTVVTTTTIKSGSDGRDIRTVETRESSCGLVCTTVKTVVAVGVGVAVLAALFGGKSK